MGIGRDRAVDFICDKPGTVLNYAVLSEVTSAVRSGVGIASDWNSSINDDMKRRKR